MSAPAGARTLQVRYAPGPQAGEVVLRAFTRPVGTQIVAAASGAKALPADVAKTRLVFAGDAGAAATRPVKAAVRGFASVTWAPTEIAISHPAGDADAALAAVLAFHDLAREARAIESDLAVMEPTAAEDVRYSYRIRSSHRAQWGRLLETLERLAGLRLRLAQLSSLAGDPPADLDGQALRLFRQLVDEAGLAERAESLDVRLEALESLYEGSVDRINDFRGWRYGHVLEVMIILLLLAEVALLLLRRVPA